MKRYYIKAIIITFYIIVTNVPISFAQNTSSKQILNESIQKGKEIYLIYCQTCHMENGEGIAGINPPLAKADYLKKPTDSLVNVILKGQSGEVIVNGKKYNMAMPSYEYLTDVQIADVLNYIKNSWGNKIPGVVTPASVQALRK